MPKKPKNVDAPERRNSFSICCTADEKDAIWKQIHKARLKSGINISASEYFLCSIGIRQWPPEFNPEK